MTSGDAFSIPSLFSYGKDESAANHRVSLYVAGVCACLLLFITIVLVSIPGDLYNTNAPACNCTDPPQQAAGCKHAKPAARKQPQCTIVVENNSDCRVTCADVGVSESGQEPGKVAVTHIAIFHQIYAVRDKFQFSKVVNFVYFLEYVQWLATFDKILQISKQHGAQRLV